MVGSEHSIEQQGRVGDTRLWVGASTSEDILGEEGKETRLASADTAVGSRKRDLL